MAKAQKNKLKPSSRPLMIWAPLGTGIIVSLFFWVPNIDSFNISKFTILGLCALVMAVLAIRSTKPLHGGNLTNISLLTFVFMLAINLAQSPNFYKTLVGSQGRSNGVLTYLFLAVTAFFISQHFLPKHISALLWSLTALGLVEAFYDVLQILKFDPIKWNNPYGLVLGTLGNSDFAAALLAICAVATLWLITFYYQNKFLAFGLIALSLIELLVLIKSNVRQSLIIFFLGAAILIFYETRQRFRKFSQFWSFLVCLVGLLAILGALQIGPLTKYIFKQSITYRGDYWRAAIRMFTHHPFFGVGLGNYGDYFNRFRDLTQVARRGPSITSDVSHSVPLDFFAMGGIILGISYLFIILLSVFIIIKKIRRANDQERKAVFVIFALLICYLLQSFISIDQIGLAVWGWIFIGIAFSFTPIQDSDIKKFEMRFAKLSLGGTVLLIGFGLIFVAIPTWRADSTLKVLASIPNQQQGVDVRAMRLGIAAKIVEITPNDSQYKTQIALYLLSHGQAEGIDYAKQAIRQNPADSTAYRYLILAYGELKDPKNVALYKAKAVLIDPFNSDLKKS